MRGVEPGELDVWLDEAERISWVRENVDTYWRSVLGDVVAALADDPSRDRFAAETTEWCALGVARMAFTAATGEVTSKTGAGTWAIEQFAPHAEVLSAALGHRHDPDPPPVGRREVLAVVDLMRDVVDAVTT